MTSPPSSFFSLSLSPSLHPFSPLPLLLLPLSSGGEVEEIEMEVEEATEEKDNKEEVRTHCTTSILTLA